MEAFLVEWAGTVLRWAHVVIAIAWIGTSFFFMWLDAHLEAPPDRGTEGRNTGVAGEAWLVHGGGFYLMRKFLVAPSFMPATLHWFKYEAYFTWITGFLLLCVVYYFGASAYLIDPDVADLAPWQAIAIGIAVIVFGWIVYDLLYASPVGRVPHLGGAIGCVLLVATAWGLGQIFGGRGAYIHVGALMGTIMTANVAMRIIPGQKRMVASLLAGERPDPLPGIRAKQRSVHNNYLTLPVLFVMLSSHAPSTYGGSHAWLTLALVFAAGALVRHMFNLRNAGRPALWPAAPAAAFLGAAMYVTAPSPAPGVAGTPDTAPVAFAEVRDIVQKHCVACHAARPSDADFAVAPKDVRLETARDLVRHAGAIAQVSVHTELMPLGNRTGMTDAERARLGAWIAAGARIP